MGDTAPPQAPAAGLGAAPGAGLLGGGSAAPRVHSAIVERLRARIAVCRQHHRSCEGRYERGRAESSDRERQSTRQLLSLVQHGQAARKGPPKPPRAAPPAHPHLLDAAPTAAPGDPRHSALLALQGPLRRKPLPSAPAHSKRPNGFVDGNFLDIKRICVGEALGAGQGPVQANSGQSPMAPGVLPLSQAPSRKPAVAPAPPPTEGLSSLGLKPVKKEPGEAQSCSRHLDGTFGQRLSEESAESLMDPELQELFNELSSISVPPLSDLELDNMISATLKQGDPFSLDLGQPQGQRSPPAPELVLDKPLIKSEFSLGQGQAAVASPQVRPPSASSAFSVATPALPSSSHLPSVPQGQPQPVAGAGRVLPSWQEVSHAQQLKQIAANHQQHGLQPPSQPPAWQALTRPAGTTPPAFVQEKTPGPSFAQQPFAQSVPMPGGSGPAKALGSSVLKGAPPQTTSQGLPRGFAASAHGSAKVLFHFSPEPGGQQPPPALASPSKRSLTHCPAPSPAQPLPGQPLPRSALPVPQKALLQKVQNPSLAGLGYRLPAQHRQEQQISAVAQSSGANSSPCSNASPASSFLTQQLVGKKPTAQRPPTEQKQKLLLPTQEKIISQDPMSRHLSRPPPDYKDQRRNTGSMSSAPYPGASPTMSLNSSPALANPVSTQALGTPSPSLLTPAPGTRVPPVSATAQNQNTFASLPCGQPGQHSAAAGMGQLVPQRNLPPLGAGPGGALAPPAPVAALSAPPAPVVALSAPPAPVAALSAPSSSSPFAAMSVGTSPQPRLGLSHSMAGLTPQRAPTEMLRTPLAAPPNWASQETPAKPQEALKPSGVCYPTVTPAAYTPHQSLPQAAGGQHFSPATAAPPNPLAPAVQVRPLSQGNQTVNRQGLGPLRSLSLRPGPLSAPALTSSAAALSLGSFPLPGQSSRPFQGSEHGNAGLAFDILSPQADGLGPALDSEADFIDSLLKTEPGSDDWMRDINLDEILGGHS